MEQDQSCEWYEVGCWLDWLRDELMQIVLWAYDAILSAVVGIMDMIPVPDFLIDLQPITIPSGVSWALQPFSFEWGVAIIVAAYVARFTLRRIPIIG